MLKKLRSDAVLRFLCTYLAIIIVVLVSCSVILGKAVAVVRNDIITEHAHLLEQSTRSVDSFLTRLYTVGLQLSLSSSLRQLSAEGDARSSQYYTVVKKVLQEYSDTTRFFDNTLVANTVITMDTIDRIIYDDAVYRSEVFQTYTDKWGIPLEEWQAFTRSENTAPHFYVSESGELFFVFPCMDPAQNNSRFGCVLFHISSQMLHGYMDFLDSYSTYSLFVCKDGAVLTAEDSLGVQGALQADWLCAAGQYRMDRALVFSQQTSKAIGLTFVLVLPQQDAMRQLSQLQMQLVILAVFAVVFSAGCAYFFSLRIGGPVNQIAQTLNRGPAAPAPQECDVSLQNISTEVSRLVLEQQENQPMLVNSFFHNLLKGDFVSSGELEYMARRAGVQLTGSAYRAAALRVFPQIDPEEIDGATVETARVLQKEILERLQSVYPAPFKAYKRNVLLHLYIFEEDDPDVLQKTLQDIVTWLEETYQVPSFWGIGTICRDLLLFWRSGEEALAMMNEGGQGALRFYSKAMVPGDAYALTYTTEEHLVQGLRTASRAELHSVIDLIHTENFLRRSLSPKQFLRLNHRITELLTGQTDYFAEDDARLCELQRLAAAPPGHSLAYFDYLGTVCDGICDEVEVERTKKRSKKMSAILDFIKTNYNDPNMGLSLCSSEFHLSEGYLSMLFKAEMRENFADYLERTRITAACEKLRAGVLINDVAEQTGYNSAQSFRRAFKRVMGVSPSEYRQ